MLYKGDIKTLLEIIDVVSIKGSAAVPVANLITKLKEMEANAPEVEPLKAKNKENVPS